MEPCGSTAAPPGKTSRMTQAAHALPLTPARRHDAPLLHVSDEPLVNVLHRRVFDFLLAAFVLMLVYMCFVPFDFGRPEGVFAGHEFHWGLRIAPLSMRDIFSNIALYIPLGALFSAALRGRDAGRVLAIVSTVTFAAFLSIAVEYGQHFVQSRVSSWIDVCANVLGAVLGASFFIVCESWLQQMIREARADARRRWWLAVCKVFVCFVLVVQLRPFDVVVDIARTGANVQRTADFHPLAAWRSLEKQVSVEVASVRRAGMDELARARWEYALDRTTDVLVYAAVAALLVLGLGNARKRRWTLYAYAGFAACCLAAIVSIVRVFLISHGFDAAHFYCGLIGWPIGCVVGSSLLLRSSLTGRDAVTAERKDSAETGGVQVNMQRAIAFGCLGLVALYELAPFDFAHADHQDVARICLLPFKAHFASKPNVAFYDISGDLLRYATVGASIAMLLHTASKLTWRRQLLLTVTLATLACAAFEVLHVFMPSRHADVTTILLATSASFAGAVALRWMRDVRRSLTVVYAEDLLTSQLIEGKTYQRIPVQREEPARPPSITVSPLPSEDDRESPGYDDATT